MNGSVPNNYSWTQLSNIVFVDYPVGTGMSVGLPEITDEEGLAAEFYGFLISFYATFPELKGMRMWLSGASYAGTSIPYIVEYLAFQEQAGRNAAVGINYQGFSLLDPAIVLDVVEEDIASVDFAFKYQTLLRLNTTFLNDLFDKAKKLGAYGFIKKHLRYPPKPGKFIVPPAMYGSDYSLWNAVYAAATDSNDCFSQYDIRYTCPDPLDQLSGGQNGADNFVNNVTGFREYIHSDPQQVWWECASPSYLFNNPNGDPTPAPADTDLLQRVLEYGPARRNVIGQGEYDFTVIADGTAIALQNTTWFGLQGFQNPPTPFHVDGRQAGVMQNERGLLFARIAEAGHNPTRKTPKVAYKLQQYMLGQVSAQDIQS